MDEIFVYIILGAVGLLLLWSFYRSVKGGGGSCGCGCGSCGHDCSENVKNTEDKTCK